MVRALLIAALACAALAIPAPVPADGPALADDASIPTAEELEAPALAVPAQDDDAAIPDAAEWMSVENGDKGGVGDISEPKLPVQRRVVDTSALDTSALDTSALDTSALDTSALDTSALNTASLTATLPTSTNTKRRSAVMS